MADGKPDLGSLVLNLRLSNLAAAFVILDVDDGLNIALNDIHVMWYDSS